MKYVCKRILMLLVTMVIVSLWPFAAFELIHGSAAEIMLGTQATRSAWRSWRRSWGWTAPSRCGIWSGWRAFSPGPGDFLQL